MTRDTDRDQQDQDASTADDTAAQPDTPGAARPDDATTQSRDEQEQREIAAWAKKVADTLPPLTEEQRERLALLLRPPR